MPLHETIEDDGTRRRLEPPMPPAIAEVETSPGGRRHVALVVDDEEMIAGMLAEVIERNGWRAIIALGSSHAIALAEEHAVDVLVTDLEMPGMSGVGLAERLRSRLGDALPVLLVSGSADAPDVELDPPYAFLPKPLSFATLMATLNALCSLA